MGVLKVFLIGVVLFLLVFSGLYLGLNDWYVRGGNTQAVINLDGTVNNSGFNGTVYTNYLSKWANDTSVSLSNAAAVPIISPGVVLIQGVYSVVTLLVSLPNDVVLPIFNSMALIIGLPPWFIAAMILLLLLLFFIGIINVLRGSDNV